MKMTCPLVKDKCQDLKTLLFGLRNGTLRYPATLLVQPNKPHHLEPCPHAHTTISTAAEALPAAPLTFLSFTTRDNPTHEYGHSEAGKRLYGPVLCVF